MLLSSHPRVGSRVLSATALVAFFALGLILYHFWTLHGAYRPLRPLRLPTTATTTTKTPEITIPKKLWYKLGPKGLSDDTRRWTDTCIKNNTEYRYEFMTDASGDAYVAKTFADRPDLVESFLSLTVPILKADFLRYLLLYAEGGIWSDLDTSCEGVPIDDWIPQEYKGRAGLVVGWEFDFGWGDNIIRQFQTWTVMARPGLPHLWTVIEDILEGIHEKTVEHNVTIAGLKTDMVGDIVDFTGPRRLTRGVIKSLEHSLGKTIDYADISKLLDPVLVGDVLIMPGYTFSSASNTYEGADLEKVRPPLTIHHYAGSWKNAQGGELV